MNEMRVSLRSLLLVVTYVAVCCTTYVSSNLWNGTLVVVATICLFGSTTLRAFKTQSHFLFGFSLVGWSWLVFWLGFYAETPAGYRNWPVPQWIYEYATLYQRGHSVVPGDGRYEEFQQGWNFTPYGHMHSLHESREMRVPSHLKPRVPNWLNIIRLAVCLTAILAGSIGGLASSRARRFRRASESHNRSTEP